MFLTKFRMNPRTRGTVRLLASPQRLHAAVLATLPPDRARSDHGRVLWRLDEPTPYERTLYIVSPGRPSLEQLQSECGWSQERSWRTADYQPFLSRLAPGQVWGFRLTANPVRSVAGQRGERGKVTPHLTAAQQRDWLVEKAPKQGFQVRVGDPGPQLLVTRRERQSFHRGSGAGRQRATLSRVQYDGVLIVTDADLLRTTLTRGMGRAKAYGCGLLTLASLR